MRAAEVIAEGLDAGLHGGAQLYVSRAGEVITDVGIGDMTPESARPWLSATKAITTVTTARLWEQQLFDLDERVADYVPGFADHTTTIRQLLTHSAGGRAAYAPHGFNPLGELLHQVDGRGFIDIATQDVLDPLGIHAAWTDAENAPSSGLSGPIRELAKLYEALLDGGRGVVSPGAISEFTKRHRTGVFDNTFGAVVDMGLGFILDSKMHGRADVPYGYGPHASENTFGHGGSQSCTGFADPDNRLVVAVMFNGMPGEKSHQQRMFATLKALYEDLGLA